MQIHFLGGDKIRKFYNYSRLRGRIYELYESQDNFARAISVNPTKVSAKLKNRAYFTQNEVRQWAKALKIGPEEIGPCFFTPEDDK